MNRPPKVDEGLPFAVSPPRDGSTASPVMNAPVEPTVPPGSIEKAEEQREVSGMNFQPFAFALALEN
tara:strand:+ start:732 stop:932 length:201 start_codon:yes stop_codon:yes gene_type:complete